MIDLMLNAGDLIEGLGAADAYMSLDENHEYWNAVVEYAFTLANDEFNMSAAAYGRTGEIKHMFEWGTLGVNRGLSNVRPQATEERARLWKAFVVSDGAKAGTYVDFEYKPSTAFVPISTNVPQDIRSLMRRHVFEWKARVMEEGTTVEIRRQQAKFLLIPYSPGMTGFRPHDISRGYTLSKGPLYARPGAKTAGTFNNFWQRYWSGRGAEKMGEGIGAELDADFAPYLATNGMNKKVSASIIESVKMRSAEIQREVAAKAKARADKNGK